MDLKTVIKFHRYILKFSVIYLLIFLRRIKFISCQKRVFVMGHMRSGSSVLAHILSSNEQILSYGETNKKYVHYRDIIENEINIRRKMGEFSGIMNIYLVRLILMRRQFFAIY